MMKELSPEEELAKFIENFNPDDFELILDLEDYLESDKNTISVSCGATTPKAKQEAFKKEKYYENKEINEFIDFIGATDNFSGSCWQLYTFVAHKDIDGNTESMPKLIGFGSRQLGFDRINKIKFYNNKDYYYTKNGFSANKRTKNNAESALFSLNNIVIDIDNHEKNATTANISRDIDRLLYFMKEDNLDIPEYSVVRSGRGCQLIIRLDSFYASKGLLKIWNQATEIICNRIESFIADYNKSISEDGEKIKLTVDRAASTNPSGLMRLPYTHNSHTGQLVTFEKLTDYRYTVDDLIELIFEANKKLTEYKSVSVCKGDYTPLLSKRVKFIEELANMSKIDEGRREITIWLYHNSLMQLTDSETAKNKTLALNQSFNNPLSEREVLGTVSRSSKKAYTFISVKGFLALLQASTEEYKMYMNAKLWSKREHEREKKRADKNARNALIVELYEQGEKYQKIADAAGCSLSTVKNVIKENAKTDKENRNSRILELHKQGKKYKEIAAIVGCSVRTVQNIVSDVVKEAKKIRDEVALKLYTRGEKCKKIAETVSCSVSTIKTIIKRYFKDGVDSLLDSNLLKNLNFNLTG